MACLDTCFLIDLAGGGKRLDRAEAKLREMIRRDDPPCVSRFSVAELYVGVYRSNDPEVEAAKIQTMLDVMEILEFDEISGLVFGRITAHLQSIGKPCGDMDVLIAAVAISNQQTLITDNASHFRDIPGLAIETYG